MRCSYVLTVLLTCGSLLGQGADDCSNPTVLQGEGVFPFDTTSATTDGAPDAACLQFGTAQIERDVWFSWTAPAAGLARVETCGATAVDTRVAAYQGATCGGPALACADDDCGLQSSLTFACDAGETFLLRLGGDEGAADGAVRLQSQLLAVLADGARGGEPQRRDRRS